MKQTGKLNGRLDVHAEGTVRRSVAILENQSGEDEEGSTALSVLRRVYGVDQETGPEALLFISSGMPGENQKSKIKNSKLKSNQIK